MGKTITPGKLPAGQIQFYDNYVPPLEAGTYTIAANQDVSVTGASISPFTQQFLVAAPQYSIDTAQIINMFPPAGSTGKYAGVLPHIVLKDPMLPWERSMPKIGTQDFDYQAPWMAIMVFEESELEEGGGSPTKITQTNVASFRALSSSRILVPLPTQEADVKDTDPCSYITMSVDVFKDNVAYLNELPFLAHARQVNTGGQVELGINEKGLFSVLFSNRIASTPTNVKGKEGQTVKNIVHLVSLEGMGDYLSSTADFEGYTEVALVSLASWTFNCQPETSEDFIALALNLAGQQVNTDTPVAADELLFRLPAPTGNSSTALTTVQKRINDGYVPVGYHTRSAEETFAWYRGPFAPVLPAITSPTPNFLTADSAMIYNDSTGLFDVSLAAAWEAGRQAALSDATFGPKLLDFRRKGLNLLDELMYKLRSDGFTTASIAELDTSGNIGKIESTLLSLLTPDLLSDIGGKDSSYTPPATPGLVSGSTTDLLTDVEAFYTDPETQAYIEKVLADDLAPIAEWLARLMLLYPLPFDNLVPDVGMLPNESIRFFYVDQNWLNAAVDGALSLGMESSQLVLFNKISRDMIMAAAMQALAIMRDEAEGITDDTTFEPPTKMSGFLLRSAIVKGWPNLVVKPDRKHTDDEFHILRMSHLSDTVLLVIFDGIPESVEISQPAESLEFGLEENGSLGEVEARSLITGANLGSTTGIFTKVKDNTGSSQLCMRSAGSNVLNIAPTSSADDNSLIYKLTESLGSDIKSGTYLSPASFAVQMVKAPESITFLTTS